jgi:hypothetical protein
MKAIFLLPLILFPPFLSGQTIPLTASQNPIPVKLLEPPLDSSWHPFIDPERQDRLTETQLEAERKKLSEHLKPHWILKPDLLQSDGQGPSLETKKLFQDFDLEMDWLIPPLGDTVLFLKGVPGPRFWDFKKGQPEGAQKGSGGLFLNKRFSPHPKQLADKPVGEWNKTKIRMRGDRVTLWLNGQLVVDSVPLENSWDRRKPLPSKGSVGFQSRGVPLQVRGMTIHLLEP